MRLRDTLARLVSNAMSSVAPIIVGIVVSFNQETRIATVRCNHRSGRGYEFYELPWPHSTNGIFSTAPQIASKEKPGTHVVLGFRGFDWSHPILLTAYDPWHYSNTREQDKRKLSTYTPRSDRAYIGQIW